MKKSTVIATCLIHSGITAQPLADVEESIQQSFNEDFRGLDFHQWNTHLTETEAKRIIKEFGSSYRIDVRQFIQDLM